MPVRRPLQGSNLLLSWAAVLSLSFAVSSARADIVHLKNGSRVEGEVSPGSQPGRLKVIVDRGVEMEFPDQDVHRVEQKKSPQREFQERLAALPAGDIDALLQLAEWARERKLRTKEELIYQRILELDPNDPVARRELGYAVFKNRWVKEADLRNKHGLVQFRGDWVTGEEKERRLLVELEKEITDLLRGVDSDNRYIREYSVKKLLEYREPRARAVALKFLADSREAVRVVAVQLLVSVPAAAPAAAPRGASPPRGQAGSSLTSTGSSRPGPAGGKAGGEPPAKGKAAGAKPAASPGPSEEEVAQALLERVLSEESPAVRTSLSAALAKVHSRRFFELALEALSTSDNPLHRDRAAEGVLAALQKAWVPEIIKSLTRRPPGLDPAVQGNPAVRSILARVAGEDFEYRTGDWEAWWVRSRHRFADEG